MEWFIVTLYHSSICKVIYIYIYTLMNTILIHFTSIITQHRWNLRVPQYRLELSKQRVDYIGGVMFKNMPNDLKLI